MLHSETLDDFYGRHPRLKTSAPPAKPALREVGNFNVNSREFCNTYAPYNRRDFYKISLIIGEGNLHYADKVVEIRKPALVFFNPRVPYSWEAVSEKQSGYFCLFKEEFINPHGNASQIESPLFQTGTDPVFFINKEQQKRLGNIYKKMLAEIDSDYIYRYDLLRNYVNLLIHESLKMRPGLVSSKLPLSSSRLAFRFIELLERQFPVDSREQSFRLRTAVDYAERLAVHVNHLNRAVKKITGKTTTEQISERLIKEANALLKNTDWSVAEIAYCLGFEYPAYFNNFFKKQTGRTPRSVRS